MTERLRVIYGEIPECESFADVGCDHGYIANAMLVNRKCERAVFSDVSEKCLEKARVLLAPFVQEGKAEGRLSDGLKNVPAVGCALIAGMGGEEIIKILKEAPFLPEKLVLQPMKNVDKVRAFLVNFGYKIVKDYVFFAENRYYDLIVSEQGNDGLTDEETEFGRTNLREFPEAFIKRLSEEAARKREFAENPDLSEATRQKFLAEAERLEKYAENGSIKNGKNYRKTRCRED